MKSFTPEELEERRGRQSASEAGIYLGVNENRGEMDLWLEKLGKVEPEDLSTKIPVVRGKLLEPWLMEQYERLYLEGTERLWINKPVKGKEKTFQHKDHPRVWATPDGYVRKYRARKVSRIVEAKTCNHNMAWQWGPSHTDQIPPTYLAQCQWQMEVLDVDQCDVIASVDEKLKIYHIKRNLEFGRVLMARAKEFWFYVENKKMPPIDASPASTIALSLKYPERGEVKEVEPGSDLDVMCLDLKLQQHSIKSAQRNEYLRKNQILEAMKDAAGVKGSFGTVKLIKKKGQTPYIQGYWKKEKKA